MKKILLIIGVLFFAGIAIGATALSLSQSEEDFVKETFKTDKREVSEVTKQKDVYIFGEGKNQIELELDSYSITTRDSKTAKGIETKKYFLMDYESVKKVVDEKVVSK